LRPEANTDIQATVYQNALESTVVKGAIAVGALLARRGVNPSWCPLKPSPCEQGSNGGMVWGECLASGAIIS